MFLFISLGYLSVLIFLMDSPPFTIWFWFSSRVWLHSSAAIFRSQLTSHSTPSTTPPQTEAVKNIWTDVEEVPVTEDELAALFQSKASAKFNLKPVDKPEEVGQVAGFDPEGTEKVRLLDNKRHNALAILLRKLPAPMLVIHAIRAMDEKVLDLDSLDSLLRALPPADEVHHVNKSPIPDDRLEEPELFIRLISGIPQISSRLECWYFKLTYSSMFDNVVRQVETFQLAINSVMQSKVIKVFFGIVLSVGNYLNGGTNRGQADGFDMVVLSRLASMKDVTTGKMSLLDYVLKIARANYGAGIAGKLNKELAPLFAAEGHSLRMLNVEAKDLLSKSSNVRKSVSLVIVSTQMASDRFNEVMDKFSKKCEVMEKNLTDAMRTLHSSFIDLVQYLEPTKSRTSAQSADPADLFNALRRFAKSMGAAEDQIQAEEDYLVEQEKLAEYNKQFREKLKKNREASK